MRFDLTTIWPNLSPRVHNRGIENIESREPASRNRSATTIPDLPCIKSIPSSYKQESLMIIRKCFGVGCFAVVTVIGCGEPPQILPAAPPGIEVTEVAPPQNADDAPSAIGESAITAKRLGENKPPVNLTPPPGTSPDDAAKAGLKVETLTEGKGDGAKVGQKVSVHYTGKLASGSTFDSSVGRQPFVFTIGEGSVIKGWDAGLQGMKVGEKRRLTIPSEYGYGKRGSGAKIPPDSTLVFDLELLKID